MCRLMHYNYAYIMFMINLIETLFRNKGKYKFNKCNKIKSLCVALCGFMILKTDKKCLYIFKEWTAEDSVLHYINLNYSYDIFTWEPQVQKLKTIILILIHLRKKITLEIYDGYLYTCWRFGSSHDLNILAAT